MSRAASLADMVEIDTTTSILRELSFPPAPTVEQIRNAVLARRTLCIAAPDTEADVKRMFSTFPVALEETVADGKLFDLGNLPNALIKREAPRAAELYAHKHLGHPFRTAYALFHLWERGGALYLVMPSDDGGPGSEISAVEFQPILLRGEFGLSVGSVAHFESDRASRRYRGSLVPTPLHALTGSAVDESAEIANIADPVMLALLLLATDGIAVTRIDAPAKLNKARAKSGKPAIPAHWQVVTGPYVTALSQRGRPRPADAPAGHHASPIPHLRRGHIRHLHERHGGGTTWVKDAVVNLADPNAPLARSFYAMQQEKAS